MITRFDHVVIGVQKLEEALESYTKLGFEVFEGGRHPSLGTRNAIIRFGLDYIELLEIEHEEIARKNGAFGCELADFLSFRSGLIGFVLATDNIDHEANQMQNSEIKHSGPFDMDRKKPDGATVAWKLVIPGASPWRKPWPFLIQWQTSDEKRQELEKKGTHSNGCETVLGIDLLVENLAESRLFYEDGLGLQPHVSNKERTALYQIGEFYLNVKEPSNEAEKLEIENLGSGPYRLVLGAKPTTRSSRYAKDDINVAFFEFDHTLTQGARIVRII